MARRQTAAERLITNAAERQVLAERVAFESAHLAAQTWSYCRRTLIRELVEKSGATEDQATAAWTAERDRLEAEEQRTFAIVSRGGGS